MIDFQAVRFGPENKKFITAANELYGHKGHIVVVSGDDNTVVTVQDPTGQVWSRTLNRLQTYTYTATAHGDDLTGYMVTTNIPVSVFSGTEHNLVLGYYGADRMYVSLPPVAFWGTTHFIAPIMERSQPKGYAIRVTASEQTEVHDFVAGEAATLNAHEFFECRPSNSSDMGGSVECSRPCLVVQYTMGWTYDESEVDATMRLVPSAESYVK